MVQATPQEPQETPPPRRICEVDFVVTLLVPVTERTRPGCREEAEAEVEYWLTEEAGRGGLNAVFRRFEGEGYSLKPGYVYIEGAES
jgi:hypothetical protein